METETSETELLKMTAEVKRLEVQNRELARQLIRNAALCGELEEALREKTKVRAREAQTAVCD